MNKTRFNTIKISFLIFTLSIFSNHLFAQTTNGIFFQAVARDNFSNPAKDRKIYVQSSIIQTTPTGTKVLTEEHQANTDATGVFSISLGNGVRVGGTASSLTTIDWSKGNASIPTVNAGAGTMIQGGFSQSSSSATHYWTASHLDWATHDAYRQDFSNNSGIGGSGTDHKSYERKVRPIRAF